MSLLGLSCQHPAQCLAQIGIVGWSGTGRVGRERESRHRVRGERRCQLAFECGKAGLPISCRRVGPGGGGAGRETLQRVIKTDRGRPILLAHTRHGKIRDLKIQPTDKEEVGTAGGWGAVAEVLPALFGAGPVGVLARGLEPGACVSCSFPGPLPMEPLFQKDPSPTPGLMNPSCDTHSHLPSTALSLGHFLCDGLPTLDQSPCHDFDQRG